MARIDKNRNEPQFPVGRYSATIDAKGRLKLPAVFRDYFNSLARSGKSAEGVNLFVTSIDRRTVRIYLLEAWLETRGELTKGGKIDFTYFNGEDLGAVSKMDRQDRVLVNADLREQLGIKALESIHLFWEDNHVLALTDNDYQAICRQARKLRKANRSKRALPHP